MFDVILFEPEIPPNTGNIIRLCANSDCRLHLIGPLGFDVDAPALRRAALDYQDMAAVHIYKSLPECLEKLRPPRLLVIETSGAQFYSEYRFEPRDALLFGPETRGLPPAVLATLADAPRLAIPMRAGNRSLNLSNAVALVVYEAWRQQGFAGAAPLLTA